LSTVKTGEELRSMKNSEENPRLYDPDMSADISIAEEATPEFEQADIAAEKVAPAGHVSFGTLGFGNFGHADLENDENRNRIETEIEDTSDANEIVVGEGLEDDTTAGPSHAPSCAPSHAPTHAPSQAPSQAPSHDPSPDPRLAPSLAPSHASDDSTREKRKRGKGKEIQNKKNKSQANNRRDIVKKLKSKNLPAKDDAKMKKNFKSDFITLKFKLSQTHLRAQTVPDFALFVLDNVHSPEAVPPSQHAGKFMTYINGSMADKFFGDGIVYDPNKFFICKDEVGLKEDRDLPFVKTREVAKKVSKKKSIPQPRIEVDDSDSSDEPDSQSHLGEKSSNEEISDDDSPDDIDIFNMQKHAKSVSWGTPARNNSEDSDSSAGVRVYGRAAEKTLSAEKRKKNALKKNHAKTSLNRTRTDILDSPEFSIKRPVSSESILKTRGRGRGKGGRGKGGRGKCGRGKGGKS